jgi:hypothetical protein
MKKHPLTNVGLASVLLCVCSVAFGHCDSLDGPVVEAARTALDTGEVARVLIWVQESDTQEVTEAFRRTLEVRALTSSAKSLADYYFFETVVRLHRQGEGAPYTGLRPAGTALGPAIRAADDSLEAGSSEDVVGLLTDAIRTGVREHFQDASSRQAFDTRDVAGGRRYVTSYVEYVHYVERIYEAATRTAQGHYPEHE